jgi:hypothetical protein
MKNSFEKASLSIASFFVRSFSSAYPKHTFWKKCGNVLNSSFLPADIWDRISESSRGETSCVSELSLYVVMASPNAVTYYFDTVCGSCI